MSDDKRMYVTRDLYEAATLVTLKFFMEHVDYQIEGERRFPVGYFNFEDTPELQEARKKYIQGLIQVEPKALFSSFKALKAQVVNSYKKPTRQHTNG